MDRHNKMRSAQRQGGFTLVELMVTVAIALFLLGGLVTIVQNIRGSYLNQEQLVQLQDEQRFALTVLTDSIQTAGYFPDATVTNASLFPAQFGFNAATLFLGTHAAGAADSVARDTVSVRFYSGAQTGGGASYGVVLCDGTDTSGGGALTPQRVQFSLSANNELQCSVNGGNPVILIAGVQAFAVYYGVKRSAVPVDYNVDTYETWDVLSAAGDGLNVSSVRVVLTFTNPVVGPNQPPTLTVERVIQVMGRGGIHS